MSNRTKRRRRRLLAIRERSYLRPCGACTTTIHKGHSWPTALLDCSLLVVAVLPGAILFALALLALFVSVGAPTATAAELHRVPFSDCPPLVVTLPDLSSFPPTPGNLWLRPECILP